MQICKWHLIWASLHKYWLNEKAPEWKWPSTVQMWLICTSMLIPILSHKEMYSPGAVAGLLPLYSTTLLASATGINLHYLIWKYIKSFTLYHHSSYMNWPITIRCWKFPRGLRGAFRGSYGVKRYVKQIPWGHGVGSMFFLMNHEARMPVYEWSRVWSQTTEQPTDPRAGLTWWVKKLYLYQTSAKTTQ